MIDSVVFVERPGLEHGSFENLYISGTPNCATLGAAVNYAYETYGKVKQWQFGNTQNDQLFDQSPYLAGLYLFDLNTELSASPVDKVHRNPLYESVK
jgi:hypothetical protein